VTYGISSRPRASTGNRGITKNEISVRAISRTRSRAGRIYGGKKVLGLARANASKKGRRKWAMRGSNPRPVSTENPPIDQRPGAESGAPDDATATIHNPVPSDLRLVIDRWATLPPAIRAAVLALVKAGA